MQSKHQTLKEKLEKLCEDGPEAIAQLQVEADKARDAANRWTGEVSSCFQNVCTVAFRMSVGNIRNNMSKNRRNSTAD